MVFAVSKIYTLKEIIKKLNTYRLKHIFFQAAKLAGWLPTDESKYPKTSHVKFGLVNNESGKRFRSRDTEVIKLADLLHDAKTHCKSALVERGIIPTFFLEMFE